MQNASLVRHVRNVAFDLIRFTDGTVPGSELLADADTTLATKIARLRIARLSSERGQGLMAQWLVDAESTANSADAEVRARLRWVVPELVS